MPIRKASLDLQLELPLGASAGDQLALPLEEAALPYRLRRKDGAAIRVTVAGGDISVCAPRHVRLSAIESALRGRRFGSAGNSPHLLDLPRDLREGASIPFLGERVILTLTGAGESRLVGSVLELALPCEASTMRIRDALHGWLQSQATRVVGELLGARSRTLDWSLSYARNRLVTLDATGRLRLGWRLVLLSRESIARLLDRIPQGVPEQTAQIQLLADGDNEPAPARTTRTAVPRAAGRR